MDKIKVMLIDDQVLLREGLKTIVNLQDDMEVLLEADHGQMAIEMLKNQDIDVILMDIKMPVIDGYTATKMIREFNTSVKIIAQSAFAQTEDIEKARAAGCDDFVTKPIKRKLLIETINALFLNEF